MPCRTSTDVHELNNVIHTVPTYDPVKTPANKQAGMLVREKKDNVADYIVVIVRRWLILHDG